MRSSLARAKALAAILAAIATVARRGGVGLMVRKLRGSLGIVRLNLFLSMPELKAEGRLDAVARRTMAWRVFNDLDFEFMRWRPYRARGIERLHEALAEGRGALVASQHVGAYRRLYYELVRRGLDVVLMVDDRVASTLAASTVAQLERQGVPRAQIDEFNERFAVVDATHRGSVAQVVAALRRNAVVMVYLDGNTGASAPGEQDDDQRQQGQAHNLTEVDFFGQRLAVRRGLAQIAQRLQTPIVPVFSRWSRWRAGLEPSFRCLPAIWPRTAEPADYDAACARLMQRLFDISEREIRRAPEQFEHWVYLHRWRVSRPAEPSASEATAEPVTLEAMVEAIEAGRQRAVRYRLDEDRVLLASVGDRQVLADATGGNLIVAGRLLADVVDALRRARSLEWLCNRLRSRHAVGDVRDALAQLKLQGLVLEQSGAS